MQKSFIRKSISVLLSLLMVLSVFGMTAFAAPPGGGSPGIGGSGGTGSGGNIGGGFILLPLSKDGLEEGDWYFDLDAYILHYLGMTEEDLAHFIDENPEVYAEFREKIISEFTASGLAYNPETGAVRASGNVYTEGEYYDLVMAHIKQAHLAVDNVIALINAIGTVEYTDECKALIDAAKDAFDALTETQQANVTNIDTLTAAEADYAALEAAAALAEAKEQLATAVADAEAYYDSIKDAYPEIAADLYTNYSMAARAMNIDDAEEVLDAVGNVNFAVEEAKKAVAEADAQTGEPTNNDGACPLCGKNHSENFVIDVIHHMLWFAKETIKNLAGLFKAFKK